MANADPSAIRRINAVHALRALRDMGPLTMAELVTHTGTSRRTLELIVNQLMEQNWVTLVDTVDPGERSVGRPARTYEFNNVGGYVLAVQLDIDVITVAVANLAGVIASEKIIRTPDPLPRSTRLGLVSQGIDDVLDAAGVAKDWVMAATVSTPGIVRDGGEVDLPMSLPEWTGFSLADEFARMLECPIRVENDAKLAAVGEKWLGIEQAGENFAWVRADAVRIGVGLVINGELYRGHDGAAGEIVWAKTLGFDVMRDHVMSGLVGPEHPRHQDALMVAKRARADDPAAIAEIRDLAEGIAPGLTALSWLLAPQEIIIGGSLSQISDLLIPQLEELLNSGHQPFPSTIMGSRLGERAIITGAIRQSLDGAESLLFNPAYDILPSRVRERAGI